MLEPLKIILRLLNRSDISLEEKAVLKSLINNKPHYPYIRRHELATEIYYKVPLPAFKQIMGHSKNSRMYEVYVQELGNEGNTELLISKGIINREETLSKTQVEMQPKYCPICKEPNKHNADFCFKCNWILSQKGAQEEREKEQAVAKEAEETKKKLAELEAQQQEGFKKMQEQIERLMSQNIQSEADRLHLFPPQIEDADKKLPIQILKELFDKGYTTVPLDKSPHAYVRSEGKEEEDNINNKEPNSEIIKLPPNTKLESKLRRDNQEEKSLIY